MKSDRELRKHLLYLLKGGGAHVRFDHVIQGLSPKLRGRVPDGLPYSPWMVLEHLRITQWDILDFSRNPKYRELKWPDAYWPTKPAPANAAAWSASVKSFRSDLTAMCKLVDDPTTDLFATIPWGDGQTLLREALLIADHNAYHLGQLVELRRLLGAWPPK